MKVIMFFESKGELTELESQPLTSGWARVRVEKVGLCGTDVAKFSNHNLPPSHTRVLGHEFIGQVHEINGCDINVSCEDWVIGMPLIACGSCDLCRAQLYNLCSKAEAIGRNLNGAFAEFVNVPLCNLIKVDVPHESYVLTDPLAVCLHAITDRVATSRQKCLVIGDGTIGCLLAWLLQQQGFDTWIKGIHKEALQLMEGLGVRTVKSEAPSFFFDSVYETVGRSQPDTLKECLRAVRTGGEIVVLGVFAPGYIFPLNARELFIREVHLRGSNAYVPLEFEQAVDLISSNKETMNKFISHHFSLALFGEALMTARKKEGFTMKIVLEPGGVS